MRLEMAQNSLRYSWSREEVDNRLQTIMKDIHQSCVDYGTEDGFTALNLFEEETTLTPLADTNFIEGFTRQSYLTGASFDFKKSSRVSEKVRELSYVTPKTKILYVTVTKLGYIHVAQIIVLLF